MSRWLRNVNALLENLDSTVEETVEEHRFNRTLADAVRVGGDGDADAAAKGVQGLLQEEAQGVDDILAKRGLLGDADEDDEDDENKKDLGGRIKIDESIDGGYSDNGQGEGGAVNVTVEEARPDSENNSQSGRRLTPESSADEDIDGKRVSEADGRVSEGSEGVVGDAAFDESKSVGNSEAVKDSKGDEKLSDTYGDVKHSHISAEKKIESSHDVLSASRCCLQKHTRGWHKCARHR